MSDALFVPLLACALSVFGHFFAIRFFPKFGLLDFPERYNLSRKKIPYPTGIIAVVLFCLFFIALAAWQMQMFGILIGILLLGITTFIDDRRPLPSWLRLGIQALVALLIFATGSRIYTITNPLEGFFGFDDLLNLDTIDIPTKLFGPLPFWSGVFTLFWLLLTMNALNWFDGIPGQVSVLSTIGFLTIGALAWSDRVGQHDLAMISFLLAGISLGGMFFDFPPNKVLMGDTGAMFYGLMLGVLTIYSGGKVATAFLVLGVPLIDVFFVVVRRMWKRKKLTAGNAKDEHLHHRLLSKGWSERQVILLTATIGALFGITALFLSTTGKFISAFVLFIVLIFLSSYSGKRAK